MKVHCVYIYILLLLLPVLYQLLSVSWVSVQQNHQISLIFFLILERERERVSVFVCTLLCYMHCVVIFHLCRILYSDEFVPLWLEQWKCKAHFPSNSSTMDPVKLVLSPAAQYEDSAIISVLSFQGSQQRTARVLTRKSCG